MSIFADAIVIDPAELRDAASSLRQAADASADVRMRLPHDCSCAPDWQTGALLDELGLLRLELDRLSAEIADRANSVEQRADSVEQAERRWWEIANGELRCGCILPGGTIVAIPTIGTAISAASGPGLGVPFSGAVVIGTAASSASGNNVVIGGGGIPGSTGYVDPGPGLTVGMPGGSISMGNIATIGGGGLPNVGASGGAPSGNIATIGGDGLDMSPTNPDVVLEGDFNTIRTSAPAGGGGLYQPFYDQLTNHGAITHLGQAQTRADAANAADTLGPGYTTRTDLNGDGQVVLRTDFPGL